MNAALNDAIARLNLQPGEVYRANVNGQEVELRALKAPASSEPPPQNAPQNQDWDMVNIWLDVPPSASAITVTARLGEPTLPAPIQLDDTDLTPE